MSVRTFHVYPSTLRLDWNSLHITDLKTARLTSANSNGRIGYDGPSEPLPPQRTAWPTGVPQAPLAFLLHCHLAHSTGPRRKKDKRKSSSNTAFLASQIFFGVLSVSGMPPFPALRRQDSSGSSSSAPSSASIPRFFLLVSPPA
jgi:hypothetical protein